MGLKCGALLKCLLSVNIYAVYWNYEGVMGYYNWDWIKLLSNWKMGGFGCRLGICILKFITNV